MESHSRQSAHHDGRFDHNGRPCCVNITIKWGEKMGIRLTKTFTHLSHSY